MQLHAGKLHEWEKLSSMQAFTQLVISNMQCYNFILLFSYIVDLALVLVVLHDTTARRFD